MYNRVVGGDRNVTFVCPLCWVYKKMLRRILSTTSRTSSYLQPRMLPDSSIPTKDEILVPETLLKKRKSQEKERESRAADLKKKREVSSYNFLFIFTTW